MKQFLVLFLSLFFSVPTMAGLERVQVKNLDLDYVLPYGKGELEKLSFGVLLEKSRPDLKSTYPVEVFRRETSFDVLSPFIDFQWLNPFSFVFDVPKASTKKFNLKIDKGEHYLKGEELRYTTARSGEFEFDKFFINCMGTSTDKEPTKRLMEDCRQKMTATVSHMELPFNMLKELAEQLPPLPEEALDPEIDLPAHDFYLGVTKGSFYSYVRIKYIVRAYLKFWGFTQYENDGKVLAIRVDKIKYGILPVTNLVMNELRRQVNHPKVTINPPWIRIQLGK